MTAADVAAADEYRDLPSGRDPDKHPDKHPGSHPAARRSAARAFRPRRTLTAIVVAAAIAAVAGLIAADLISKYLGHPVHVIPAAVARDGRSYHWGDPRPLVASGVICALGLLLISIAALPGRFRVVPVASEDSLSVTGFTRAGLRRYLAAAATTVDGVASARVRVRRRHVRVLAVSPLRDSEGLVSQVETAVRTRIDHLAPLSPLRVSVTVRKTGD